MMNSNQATLVGNLTDDPELRFTQGGIGVCTFRLAVNQWKGKDKEDATTYWSVTVWREMADNVAESLSKGDRVLVVGELIQRSYENKDGITVWVTEVKADEVAPSLRFKGVGRASASKRVEQKEPDDVPF